MKCGLVLVLVVAAACGGREPSAPDGVKPAGSAAAPAPSSDDPHERELAELRSFEQKRRIEADFAAVPASDAVLGPDPYRLAPFGDGLIGILRGESSVVLLDRNGAERARWPAPRSPSGLAVSTEGDALVVGDNDRALFHYAGREPTRVPVDAIGMRDVALAPDARTAYIVEEHEGRLLAVSLERQPSHAFRAAGVRELGRCHGPIQVAAVADYVAVDCLLDHTIELRRVGAGGVIRIHHDGPIWRFALQRQPDGSLLIAAGGVEDHPLVREDGGFGYIDSFLFLYRLAPGGVQPVRLAAINASELDVVTPKWLAIRAGAGGNLSLTAAGYGSAGMVTLTWRGGDFASAPSIAKASLVPGTTAAVLDDDGLIAADPLLDGWVVQRGGAVHVVPAKSERPARPVLSRIGEALFFTTLMSPWNSSEGQLSRFTCETCHFEGYIDGRTHFTGRGDVFATTRPLVGLFTLRPYFSRALDKTMAQMVHAEFRVANRHNGRDPWFSLGRADVPWLDKIDGAPAELSAEQLREALMTFLGDFTHRPNPAAIAHAAVFGETERAGAQVFRDRCASCHEARLVADDASTVVPFERWESLVLSANGPLVWSNASYQKTGVLPYVHPDGARVAPLRRLYKKWPYFTNGKARSLDDLLDRFAYRAGSTATALHDGAPADAGLARLTREDKASLRAFLDLL